MFYKQVIYIKDVDDRMMMYVMTQGSSIEVTLRKMLASRSQKAWVTYIQYEEHREINKFIFDTKEKASFKIE